MSLQGEERKQKILSILDNKGKIRVNDLVEELEVSYETIRRYLDEMDKEGQLKKVYGGAMKTQFDQIEAPMHKRNILQLAEKRVIGKLAAKIVKDNDVIAIDEGTTPLQLIRFLEGKKNITVVTNSLQALVQLTEAKEK